MPSLEEGALAVRLARAAAARAIGKGAAPEEEPTPLPALFHERRGVFVTWYQHQGRHLRGCIGFPRAVLPLAEGLREAAVSAAVDDPRFPPVTAREFPSLVVEVSLLSPFEPLALRDRPDGVKVGRDGLAVEAGPFRGLLLPQVAPAQEWDNVELLNGTCEKAGLDPSAWRSAQVAVYRFEAEVFSEKTPGGEVVRAGADA